MEEEIEALQAIFQDEFERLSTSCICITFNHIKPGPVSITVHYPPAASYPFEKQQSPAFEVNTVWPLHLKGPGHFYTLAEEDLAQLKESFINISAAASDVYMFEWIETFKVFMEEKFGIFDADEGDQDKEVDQLQVEAESLSLETTVKANGESCMTRCKIKIHTASEELVEKKSVFVGHVARVESVEEVKLVMKSLLENKRIARATHNISAYRLCMGDVKLQDCDDDGEDAAGARLLHLLNILNLTNTLVVVSRWYGGVKLGPSRFKFINNAGRKALQEFNFIP